MKLRLKFHFLHVLFFMCLLSPFENRAQQHILVNLSSIDGIDITPDNILNFRIQNMNTKSTSILVRGVLRYRNSPMSISYSFKYSIGQGVTMISSSQVHPQWQFSSSALQELFFVHHILPAGTFEYCVNVDPVGSSNEVLPGGSDECIYHQSDDFFLINLLMPENKAKISEYYPMLNWVANYTFVNELTYRLRVAEMKQGQNPATAVLRNQPVYDEKNIFQNSKVYPTYAKPLVNDQPYAWTVDAYYKGILLGSAEAWQFIIKDDTVNSISPANRSYIDIKKENGTAQLYAIGELKLKYVLDKRKNDILTINIKDESGKIINAKQMQYSALYGDNRYIINLKDGVTLKHNAHYLLQVSSQTGEQFQLAFIYLNPDFQ